MLKNSTAIVGCSWIVQFENSEFGPFSSEETVRVVHSQSLQGKIRVRRFDLSSWYSVNTFLQVLNNPHGFNDETKGSLLNEKRDQYAKRCPVLATVSVFHSNKNFILGVCCDISLTGMQIFNSAHLKVTTGQRLNLLVIPVSSTQLNKIETAATVVWVTDEPAKIGFKFNEKITDRELVFFIDSFKK
jgi:hypothetical protein